MTEPLTGLDEAVEAACRAFYLSWDWDDDDPDDLEYCRNEMRLAIAAAGPIIAAAVRADERAKVVAFCDLVEANEAETREFAEKAYRDTRERHYALGMIDGQVELVKRVRALTEPTP